LDLKIFKLHYFDRAVCVADQLPCFLESFNEYNFSTAFLLELFQFVNHFATEQLNFPPATTSGAHEELGIVQVELAQQRAINSGVNSAHYFKTLILSKIYIIDETLACSHDALVEA
jgi:hypothetical protein